MLLASDERFGVLIFSKPPDAARKLIQKDFSDQGSHYAQGQMREELLPAQSCGFEICARWRKMHWCSRRRTVRLVTSATQMLAQDAFANLLPLNGMSEFSKNDRFMISCGGTS